MAELGQFKGWETNDQILEKFFYWIRFESKKPSLTLDIDNKLDLLAEEIMPKIPVSMVHRDYDGNGWRAVTLHGYSSIMTDDNSYYTELGFNLPEQMHWTSISNFFPKTKEWIIKNIPFSKFGRIRIMILEPGGYVLPHIDYPKGNCLAGVNIAISHPNDVSYQVNGREIYWKNGDSKLIDIGTTHEIRNNSDKPRVHIIVHSNPIELWSKEMMAVVCRSYIKECYEQNN